MVDKIKLVIAVLLVAGGIVGFHYLEGQMAVLYRVLILLAAIAAAIVVAVTSAPGMQVVNFGRAAAVEMRKSVWPTRRETTQTTMIVLVMVAFLGVMIFIIDSILRWAVKALI